MPFLCLFDADNHAVQNRWTQGDELLLRTSRHAPVTVIAPRGSLTTRFAETGEWCAAGDVRLDNRRALAAEAEPGFATDSDLMVLLKALARSGPGILDRVWGDFAFVAWNTRTGERLVARDPLAVKPLFMRAEGSALLVSSHVERLRTSDDDVSEDFLADFLATGGSRRSTIWRGCLPCAPGTVTRHLGEQSTTDRGTTHTFWNADDHVVRPVTDEEAIAGYRRLLADAILTRLDRGPVWSQLSGGVDSSSLVCFATKLCAAGETSHRLAGTVTMVDSFVGGVDATYSRLVTDQTGLRNEQLVDYSTWRDFPRVRISGQPNLFFPYMARSQAIRDLMHREGATALLSGAGSDESLLTTLLYAVDWWGSGSIVKALREVFRWSVGAGHSFWEAVAFVAGTVHRDPRTLVRHEIAPWIDGAFAGRLHMTDRVLARGGEWAPRGHKYRSALATALNTLPLGFDRQAWDDTFEIRYPFTYRPLVEYCLSLPPDVKNRPRVTKWVLREVMKGILPEPIRQRGIKDGIEGRFQHSLKARPDVIQMLVENSVLAEWGIVSRPQLREYVERARRGALDYAQQLAFTLALETWLTMQLGRWSVPQPAEVATVG